MPFPGPGRGAGDVIILNINVRLSTAHRCAKFARMIHDHPCNAYVLCSNPRSGTTLLCDLLRQTGVAGAPNSFFRQKSLSDWCADWGMTGQIDPLDRDFSNRFFKAMHRAGTDTSETFGLRLMGPDLTNACDWLARLYPAAQSDSARFEAAFGLTRYIHLSRTDKLAEAVSYLRAEQTGLWHSHPDGSDRERIAPSIADGYDTQQITQRMEMLRAFDDAWDAWFAAEGINPLRLTYDALSSDALAVVRKVLEFIGKDPAAAVGIRPGTRKLADEVSADWIARYRRHHPG